jgi:hypothetical protein
MTDQIIDVGCVRTDAGWRCDVTLGAGARERRFVVTVTEAELERYAAGAETPEVVVEASFRFLLDHESPDAILPTFTLPTIERYFPDYPTEIARTMARG